MQQNAVPTQNPAAPQLVPPRKNRDRLFKSVLVCVVLVVVAVIAVPSYLLWRVTRPVRITRDFVGEYHATFEKIPESELAWPWYLSVIETLKGTESLLPSARKDSQGKDREWADLRPGDQGWAGAKLWLESVERELEIVRKASSKESLGFPITRSSWNPSATSSSAGSGGRAISKDLPLLFVQPSFLGEVRQITRVLRLDMRSAAESRDARRFIDDARSIRDLGRQTSQFPSVISLLVSCAIHSHFVEGIIEGMGDGPPWMGASSLSELHELLESEPDWLDLKRAVRCERNVFEDCLQRLFSDDGSGDGYINYRAMRSLAESGTQGLGTPQSDAALVAVALVTGRREAQLELYDRVISQQMALTERPLHTLESIATPDVPEYRASWGFRYQLVALLAPSLMRAHAAVKTTRFSHRTAQAALAMVRFKHEHERWPRSIDEIVPAYVPDWPNDVFDGSPLRVIFGDGPPLIYSVGSDRIDQRGAPGPSAQVREFRDLASVRAAAKTTMTSRSNSSSDFSGDWVIFPASIQNGVDVRLPKGQSTSPEDGDSSK